MVANLNPLVSVLVTVHNRELYLSDALRSVLDSTQRDFEVIVVDDGSTDASLEIAGEFAGKDHRVHVHRNEQNLGDYPNRMKAASLAQGRYIKYVDSDDVIYPHSLAIMVESMERNPDAALGLSHSMPEEESPYPWRLTPEQTYRKHFLDRGCLSCGPSGAIIRRDAFEAVGGFRPEWGVLSDTDLWHRMAARWPLVLMPPGLVWWRRHAGQEFSKDDAGLVYLQRGYELTKAALASPGCPLAATDRDVAMRRSRQHFSRRLWSLALRRNKPRAALKVFRDSDLKPTDLLNGLRPYR